MDNSVKANEIANGILAQIRASNVDDFKSIIASHQQQLEFVRKHEPVRITHIRNLMEHRSSVSTKLVDTQLTSQGEDHESI